uniref:Amino acid transporter transmembrane domain-containing protein n=2 Tax=Odontella aurita TaxID=265563 RepID=A0A7S4JZN1_9STRA|mmetsp:Transcript_57783/g.172465  ORF Transcript_57783/g.172465 Transcript_57783/m.172465 type:complete len:592 (+) Transcript_57783:209-1984(+)
MSEVNGETTPLVTAKNGGDEREVAAREDEMALPWPATFDRSISLLARPHLGAAFVKHATESLHLPPHGLRRNRSLKELNRGYNTPDPQGPPITVKSSQSGVEYDAFHMGIKKIQSLDWRLKLYPPTSKDLEAQKHSEHLMEKTYTDNDYNPRGDENEHVDAHATGNGDKSSFGQCVFNMANTLMGVGMLGLPFVFGSVGWYGGIFVLLLFSAITWWTSILIGRELNGNPQPTHKHYGKDPGEVAISLYKPLTSFPGIAREAFGQRGTIALSSVLYFELFSSLSIFFVMLGDHMHTLFPQTSTSMHMVFVAFLLSIPTVLLKTPRLLSYMSVVGTASTIAVVLAVLAAAVIEGDIAAEVAEGKDQLPQSLVTGQQYHTNWKLSGLPLASGIVAYCFSGHAIVPSLYSSMSQPRDFEKMMTVAYAIVLLACGTVAVSGYYMFGSEVEDQITLSLEMADIRGAEKAMTVLVFLMILTAFSKFSLFMFPLALGVEEIIAPWMPTDHAMEASYALIKVVLILLSLCVALFVPSFGFLCSLIGLICTVIVSIIFPAAAHLKLFGPQLRTWEKVVDWLFVIGGALFAIIGTVATVSST